MEEKIENILKELLKTRTQDQLAVDLGVHSRSIQNYLKGETPSKKVQQKIRETFGKETNTINIGDIELNAIINNLFEQQAALTANLKILRPIVEELYAAYKSEMLAKIRTEIGNLIDSEGERILSSLLSKWKTR